MAIRVPMLSDGVRAQAPTVRTPSLAAPGSGISEAGVFEAEAGIGQQISKAGQVLAQRLIERRDMRDRQAVLASETEFRIQMQDALLSDEKIGGVPRGFLNRQLGQADGITVEYDQHFKKVKEQFLRDTENDRQAAELESRMNSFYASSRSGVLKYEAKQFRDNSRLTLDANLKRSVADAASITDPEFLNVEIDNIQKKQTVGLASMGQGREQIALANEEITDLTAKISIEAMSDRNPVLAQRTLDAVEERLTPGMAADLRRTVDAKIFSKDAATLWGSLTATDAFKRENGTWKSGEMKSAVMALNEPQKRREQLWNYVKANINEDHAIQRQAKQALALENDDFERELFIRANDKDLTIREADSLLAKGKIDIPFYNTLASRIRKRNDDPDIPEEEKSKRYLELIDAFDDLKGGKVDKKRRLIKQARGNDLETLKAFRKRVSDSAGHLTERQERTFLDLTQKNFDEAMEPKRGILKAFVSKLAVLALPPATMAAAVTNVFDQVMKEQTSVEQAAEITRREIRAQAVTKNPNGTVYKIGDPITVEGSTEDWRVVGFDLDNEPLVEVAK